MKKTPCLPRSLLVTLSFGSRGNTVGVRIGKSGSARFVLVGNLIPAEATGFMNYVLANELTDDEIEAYARRYDLKPPLR